MQSMKDANNKKILLGDSYGIDSIIPARSEYFIEGDKNKKIRGIAPIDDASIDDLSFCSSDGEKAFQLISNAHAGIILCGKSLKGFAHPGKGSQLAFVDNPRLVFVQFINRILKNEADQQLSSEMNDYKTRSAHSTSVISPEASIGNNCKIGNFVMIGNNCKIGNNTIIHDRVTLVQNCIIGNNCVIQSGVTIGEDGFAYERTQSSELAKFPHFGGVIIGNNVEICANCSIARGSLTDTVIGDDTKIDALVHIAHNVKIGRNCQLTAGTVIGGSSRLGNSCWTGLNCTIKNKVNVGNNAIIGAGACVIKDIQDGDIVAGVPAKSIKDKVSTNEVFQMAGQKTKMGGQE